MSPEDDAIRRIEQIARQARESGAVSLSPDYVRAVERIESLPQNQPGADKSWVPKSQAEFFQHYRRARRR